MLSRARLLELLDYNPDTGIFVRRIPASNFKAGNTTSATPNGAGYLRISVDGVRYQTHKLAWLYIYGEWPARLDHRDRDRTNNRIKNLRPASPSQNTANSRLRSNNTSGFKGVEKHHKKWRASIRVDGKRKHLGLFVSPDEAHAAYLVAAEKYFGEFAHGG